MSFLDYEKRSIINERIMISNQSVTILIPTHNRHGYLSRCVDWFVSFGYQVVIADSSPVPWPQADGATCLAKYIHRPGGFDQYMCKICDALDQISTPYVAFCADDDFILPSGLEFSAGFLDNNPDYVFCQGVAYFYQDINKKIAVWPILYQRDIGEDSWVDRVICPKNTVYYGLNRVSVVRDAFGFLREQPLAKDMRAAGLVDATYTAISARAGKLMFSKLPFGLREYSPQVFCVGTRHELLFDPSLTDFYHALLKQLQKKDSAIESDVVRLKKWLAHDLAGQIMYDITASTGVRHLFARWPKEVQSRIEYYYRQYGALMSLLKPGGVDALALYSLPDYTQAKQQILKWEIN